jgi:hypothetical protein
MIPGKPDYESVLEESAATGQYQTAKDVDPADVEKLKQRLRYLAGKLGLDIHITTDSKEHTVSFLTVRKVNNQRG